MKRKARAKTSWWTTSTIQRYLFPPITFQENYIVCDIEDIKRNQNERVRAIVELFNVNDDEAVILLREYKWNNDRLETDWFENERKVRIKCGIDIDPQLAKRDSRVDNSKSTKNKGLCNICFSPFEGQKDSLHCGHEFCTECWQYYLLQKVSEGYVKCISSTCP